MFEINYRAIFSNFAPFFLKKTLNILDVLNFIPKYFQEYRIYYELTKIQRSLRLNEKKIFHRGISSKKETVTVCHIFNQALTSRSTMTRCNQPSTGTCSSTFN